MFWIAFILASLFNFFQTKSFPQGVPKSHLIYSILGVDQMVANFGISTFSVVGEWFLGVIILIYLVFPLLRFLILRFPKSTAIITIIVWLPCLYFTPASFPETCCFLYDIPIVMIGMYFVRYIKRVPLPVCLISLGVFIANSFLQLPVNEIFMIAVISSSAFFILVYLSKFINFQPVRVVTGTLSKYSYAVFLIHHFIYLQVFFHCGINISALSPVANYVLFLGCFILVMALSIALFKLNGSVLKYVSKMFIKTKEKEPQPIKGSDAVLSDT